MKYFYSFLIFISFSLYSQNSEPINFDGLVELEEWNNFPSFDISYEIEPGNNIAPPYRTKAYVTYSKTHMYVGFNAQVPRDQIRSAIRNRDQVFQDDRVAMCIDTFGDGRYMICLGSNANNIQFDLKFATDDIDTSYDVNYENKTQLTDKGYDVELKIPFSAYQFKNKPELETALTYFLA